MSILLKNTSINSTTKDVRITDDVFTEISSTLTPESGDTVIDASGKILIPSFKNGHTHSAMTLLRGWGDDMKLQPWLEEKIWPMEEKIIRDPEATYWGTRFACLEMIKSGTTFANDMYFNLSQNVKAFKEAGIKSSLGTAVFDFFDSDKTIQMKKLCEKEYTSFDGDASTRFILAAHSVYTVSSELLKWMGDFASANDIPLHIHLAETQKEVDYCQLKFGKSPVKYLKDLGILSRHLIAAHVVWVSDDDLKILADYGVTVVHNPVSNMKLSVGKTFPYKKMRELKIPIMLGTDGAASNNNLNMFEEMKFAALLQKHNSGDPEIMKASEIFSIATGEENNFFPNLSGTIKTGSFADCLLLDQNNTELIPAHNLTSNLVYSSNGNCVDTVICNGKILMENRKIKDEEEIIDRIRSISEKLIMAQ